MSSDISSLDFMWQGLKFKDVNYSYKKSRYTRKHKMLITILEMLTTCELQEICTCF